MGWRSRKGTKIHKNHQKFTSPLLLGINLLRKTLPQLILGQLSLTLWNGADTNEIPQEHLLEHGQISRLDVFLWKICRIRWIPKNLGAVFNHFSKCTLHLFLSLIKSQANRHNPIRKVSDSSIKARIDIQRVAMIWILPNDTNLKERIVDIHCQRSTTVA